MMSLRLTSGRFKGRVLQVPKGEGVRPTTARVRQSVFAMLQAYLPQARCLDVFAGSGVMGLEALSYGASYVLAFEKDKQHAQCLTHTLQQLGLGAKEYQLIQRDALALLREGNKQEPYDWVYCDPPYGFTQWPVLIQHLVKKGWLASHGVLLIEHAPKDALPVWSDYGLTLWRYERYGDTHVQLLTFAETQANRVEDAT